MGKRITIKQISVFLLAIVVLLVSSSNAFAYVAPEHNKLMRDILFGGYYSHINKGATNKLKALEKAVALTLDQEHGTGQKNLNFLNNEFNVKGIVKSISEINLPTGVNHRMVHVEWENGIDKSKKKLRSIWEKRKRILKNTVKKVFKYNILNDEKCDVMASIFYYIHILGDYFEIFENKDKYIEYREGNNDYAPVIEFYRKGDTNIYLLNELRKKFQSLFSFQHNTLEYDRLDKSFDNLETYLRNSWISRISITSNDYESFKSDYENFKKDLTKYVPKLMHDNKVFKDAFY